MYKAIVFDVDGTIIDTEKSTLMALKKVLEDDMNIEVDENDLEDVLGIPGKDSINRFKLKNPDNSLKKWVFYMHNLRAYNKFFNGIVELLNSIEARGIKLGIVTSRTQMECDSDPLLNTIKNQFDCIITADDTALHKPSGAPLMKLLEVMKLKAEEIIYVGDTIYDSMCAKEANVEFIWAGWGTKVDVTSFEEPVASNPLSLDNFIECKVKGNTVI